jgi:hypothetical protein
MVYVYGKNQGPNSASDVKSYADLVFQLNPQDIHSDVVALTTAVEYSEITGTQESSGNSNKNGESSDDGLSRVGILMIVIAAMLVLAISYYIYIHWSEREYGDTMFSAGGSVGSDYSQRRTNSRRRQWNKIFKRQQRRYRDYDPEEKSIRHSLEAEVDEHDHDDSLAGENFEDEYGGNDDHVSRVTSSSVGDKSRKSSRSKVSLDLSEMSSHRYHVDDNRSLSTISKSKSLRKVELL